MNNAIQILPRLLQQAQTGLGKTGIPLAAGTAMAVHFYHQTPQVSQNDALRRERNKIQY